MGGILTPYVNSVAFPGSGRTPLSPADSEYRTLTYDGMNRLFVRTIQSKPGVPPDLVFIYCYGNTESTQTPYLISNLRHLVDDVQSYVEADEKVGDPERSVALIVFDYPGYGKSDGEETTAENASAALEAVYHHAVETFGESAQYFLWGRSIGSVPVCAVTAKLFAEPESAKLPSGIVLQSALASTDYTWCPFRFEGLMNNLTTIETAQGWPSTLLIHGEEDRIISYTSSVALHNQIMTVHQGEGHRILLVHGKGHDDIHFSLNSPALTHLVTWLQHDLQV